jgi:hypothetical protein
MKVEGAGVLSDPDPDVDLDGYPAVQAVGDLEREDENCRGKWCCTEESTG